MIGVRILETGYYPERITGRMDKANRRNLGALAGMTRKSAIASIKRRKAVSKPGNPPSSHTDILKKFIRYALLRRGYGDTFIAGPAKTNQTFFGRDRRPIRGTVPEVLEKGGDITIFEVEAAPGRWKRADLRGRRRLAGMKTRYRPVHIGPRPFMAPAFGRSMRRAAYLWGGSISK